MQPQPRYRKGDRIGERYLVYQALLGGMGEVYLCLDVEQNLPYALKTFQQRYLTNPRIRQLFAHEIGTWIALEKHPNIVRCFNMDILDNQPYMLLEWVAGEESPGTDLRSWLKRGPLDLRTALDFIIDICRGLIHANEKQPGIVHRDLKPENILVAQGRLAKITDFGLASLIQQTRLELARTTSTKSGRHTVIGASGIVGTPPYMAPEQWRGEPGDARTDIYAVGCILYELLTGTLAYQATTLEDFQRLHTSATLPPITATESTPRTLNALLARCLAKQLAERFADLTELLDAVIELYRAQVGSEPRTMLAVGAFTAIDYSNRGVTYHKLGHNDAALADYNQAIKLDSTIIQVYNNRGISYAELGLVEYALADFTRAIEQDPTVASSYANRGRIYHKLGRFQDALDDFSCAIEHDSTAGSFYSNRGVTYAATGQFNEAIADYTRAIAIDPSYAQAYNNHGNILGKLGRFHEALTEYSQAINLDPAYAEAYFNRADAYSKLGQIAEALADYTRAIEWNPAFAVAYMMRGNTYAQLGQIAEALADYTRAIECDPTEARAYYNRGGTYEKLGRIEEALSDYTRAIECDHTHAKAYCARGYIYTKLAQWEIALSNFTDAIAIDSAFAFAYYGRGSIYLALGQFEAALSDFTHAITLDSTYAPAYYNRGVTYTELGRIDDALADYTHAIELDPSDADPYINTGVLLKERGKLREALPYFEHAAKLGDPQGLAYALGARRELEISSTEPINPVQQAFDIFQRATSRADLSTAVAQFPVLTDPQFITAVEQVISQQVPADHRHVFEQRLEWLQEIVQKSKPTTGLFGRLFGKKK